MRLSAKAATVVIALSVAPACLLACITTHASASYLLALDEEDGRVGLSSLEDKENS